MIKAPNFTYIHPVKCGGTFINKVLVETTNSKEISYHLPRSRAIHNDNFITSVRNPFDWYVSFYHHSLKYKGYIFDRKDNFKGTVISLLNLRNSPLYKTMLNHDWVADTTPNIREDDFINYPNDIGFCSWNWNRMVGDKDGNSEDVHVMRLENI